MENNTWTSLPKEGKFVSLATVVGKYCQPEKSTNFFVST